MKSINKCSTCDVIHKHCNKIKCNNCYFNVDINNGEIYTSFKLRSLFNIRDMRKHHFFYFLYHPELNWKFPNIPMKDLNENLTSKTDHWVIHHEDENHYNDLEWNLILLLNSEHSRYHKIKNNPMKLEVNKEKVRQFQKVNSIEKIRNGTHIFIKNNPAKNIDHPIYDRCKLMVDYIINNEYEKIEITRELAQTFGYSERYMMTNVLKTFIEKFKINLKMEIEYQSPKFRRIDRVFILKEGTN